MDLLKGLREVLPCRPHYLLFHKRFGHYCDVFQIGRFNSKKIELQVDEIGLFVIL